jgi:hypothetical protein
MSTQFDVDMYKNDQVTRRYSEGFKLKILAELSTGEYFGVICARHFGQNVPV